ARVGRGGRLAFGPLGATVGRRLGPPRLVALRFEGTPDAIWAGLARHGRPIQYAHIPIPLSLWDVWTSIAGPPVAFEPPSAGFALDWRAPAAGRAPRVAVAPPPQAARVSSPRGPRPGPRLAVGAPHRHPPAPPPPRGRAA